MKAIANYTGIELIGVLYFALSNRCMITSCFEAVATYIKARIILLPLNSMAALWSRKGKTQVGGDE